jgi:hypothetical protein
MKLLIERYIIFKHDLESWSGLMGNIFCFLFPYFSNGI